MNLTEIRKSKVEQVINRITIHGALQRNTIYNESAKPKNRKAFRKFLISELSITLNEILLKANYTYEDTDHYHTIVSFAKKISRNKEFGIFLDNNRLRIGTAQKLINLYWKMSWLFKPNIEIPIHCPFDGIIIKELDSSVHDIRWTVFDTINDYKRLVKAAKKEIEEDECIAGWELERYDLLTLG